VRQDNQTHENLLSTAGSPRFRFILSFATCIRQCPPRRQNIHFDPSAFPLLYDGMQALKRVPGCGAAYFVEATLPRIANQECRFSPLMAETNDQPEPNMMLSGYSKQAVRRYSDHGVYENLGGR